MRSSRAVSNPCAMMIDLSVRGLAEQLARHRMRAGEAAIDRDRLSVDIACLIAREEQRDIGEFLGLCGAAQRVQLAELVRDLLRPRLVEGRFGHPGFRSAERRVGKECVRTCRSRW